MGQRLGEDMILKSAMTEIQILIASYSQLDHTYECPPHAANTTFLVGNKNFTVDEEEVFVFQE